MIRVIKNEALGLMAIQAVLIIKKKLSLANVCLIAPLLFDSKICNYLKRKNVKVISAQEVITAHNKIFIGFNEKFIDSLIVSANSILVGVELGIFRLEGNELYACKMEFMIEDECGGKAVDMVRASKNASVILSESPEVLYSLLRIRL